MDPSAQDSGPGDDPAGNFPPARLSGRSAALIAAFGMSLLLVQFGRPWALTFHEVNFAEPAREFLRSGDWLVPRVMGRPLWDKPPLMHWSIAATMAALGTEAEWAARLPSALSAVATSLLVAALASRWYGGRVGLIAGLVQSSTIYVFMQGRLAEADMMLCAAVTAAMASFAAGVTGRESSRPARGWALAYFAAAGLAFLVKGPIGPALVAAGSGLFAVVERRRGPWRLLLDPAGWAAMILLVLAWPAAAMLREPGLAEVWWRHNAERFGGGLAGGAKDPFFYLYTAPWLALPWTPLAVLGALGRGGRSSETSAGARWRLLACWTAGMVLLLSLSSWKHKHYIIPALPPLSIWAALGLARLAFAPGSLPTSRWRLRTRAAVRAAMPAMAVVGLSAGVGLLASGRETAAAVGFASGMAGLGLTLAGVLGRRGRPAPALASLFGATWAAFVAVHSLAMPEFDDYRGQADLARRVAASLPEDADLSVVAIPDPQVTYYLPIPVRRHDGPRSLALRLRDDPEAGDGPVFVVGPQRVLGPLARLGEVRVIDRADSVHPRKGEPDRMIAVEIRPDPLRLVEATSSWGPTSLLR